MEIVTKIQAAEAQLASAISLHFQEGEEISSYTLARASHEILERLCVKAGHGTGFLEEGLKQLVKPEHQDEVRAKVNKAKNYFKHADRDLGETLEWGSGATPFFLWDAAAMYSKVAGERNNCRILVFRVLFRIEHENLWAADDPYFTPELISEAKRELAALGRVAAFRKLVGICENFPNTPLSPSSPNTSGGTPPPPKTPQPPQSP